MNQTKKRSQQMPMTMISFLELWFTFEIWTRILKKIKTFDGFYEKQNTALPPGIPLKFWYRTALPYRLPPPLPYTAQTHTAWAVSNPSLDCGWPTKLRYLMPMILSHTEQRVNHRLFWFYGITSHTVSVLVSICCCKWDVYTGEKVCKTIMT